MFVVVLVMVIVTALISWSWVNGIDYMKENHPDYKGMDLFGEDEEEWDNNSHTEGKF